MATLNDRMNLADALFGQKGQPQARRVAATATGDSSDGKVTVEFADGETAEVGTIAPVSEGQKVTMLLQDGQATVIGADGWGDGVQASIERTEQGLESKVSKADAEATYATQTTLTQTSTDLTARIQAAQSTADGTATMIRAFGDGVLVAKYGNSVGALVNAEGSFDVVYVTWPDYDHPSVAPLKLSSLAASKATVGSAEFTPSHATFAGGDLIIDTATANDVTNSRVRSVGNLGLYAEGYSSIILGQHTASGGYISDMGMGIVYTQDGETTKTSITANFDALALNGGTISAEGTTLECNGVSGALPADWITESGDGGGWNIPQATTKQTATNTTGWRWELYRSGKIHMWGIVANGSADCTQLSNGIYRETSSKYIALPKRVRYIKSMTYGGGLPGFAFGVGATSADSSAGYWSDSGLVATGYRFVAHASGTYQAAATVDIWATV